MTLNVLYTAQIRTPGVGRSFSKRRSKFGLTISDYIAGKQHVQKCFSYVQRLLEEELYA